MPAPEPSPETEPEPETKPAPEPEPESKPIRDRLGPLLDAYFALHKDLAKDRASGERRAEELRHALADLGIPTGETVGHSLREATDAVGGAGSLKAQRKAFEGLSAAVAELVRRYGAPGERSVRRFHCPMAFKRGADWLQEGETTENPYFGSRMFRCGRQVEVLPNTGAGR